MTNKSNRIGFYLRSATGNLTDLRRQRKLLENELVSRRFDFSTCPPEIYRDTHQSGLRPGPEFMRMCQDIAAGNIDVVMVSRTNRISRSIVALLEFTKFAESHRVRFVSVENVDPINLHSMQRVEGFAGG